MAAVRAGTHRPVNRELELARRGVLVGITAWTEPTLLAAGTFYPPEATSAEARLRFYATQFPIAEVDATFYGPPSERLARLWVERTPPGFVFDVKAFRLFTEHPTPPASLWSDLRAELPAAAAAKRRLYVADLPDQLVAEAARRFVAALRPLHDAGRLGVVLLQFPHYVYPARRSFEHLSRLAELLSPLPAAVELRQARWMDDRHRDATLRFLAGHGFAYVCVDEPQGFPSSIPPIAAATADLAVVRFHGRRADLWGARDVLPVERYGYEYQAAELREWVPRIRELHEGARLVHALMNNCHGDFAVRGARMLAELLDAARVGAAGRA